MKAKPRADSTTTGSSATRWGLLLCGALAISGLLLGSVYLLPVEDPDTDGAAEQTAIADPAAAQAQIDAATRAVASGDFAAAEKLATSVDLAGPLADQALLLAGEAASRDGRFLDAAAHYRQLADMGRPASVEAAFYLGEVLRNIGRLEEAAAAYQRVLDADPTQSDALARLAFIYSVTGQPWEAMPYYLGMVRYQQWSLDSLALLGDLERPIEQPQFIGQCAQQNPNGDWVRLGQAQVALQAGEEPAAERILRDLVTQRPQLLAAQAMLGQLLIAQPTESQNAWLAQLPDAAASQPDIWFARGMMARSAGQLEQAAGCFAEAVRLVPEHRRATYQLGQVLASLNEPSAPDFVKRAEQLVELSQVLDEVLKSRGQSEEALRRAAEISQSSGRSLEAWAWAMTASRFHPAATWAPAMVDQLSSQIQSDMPRTVPAADLITTHPLTAYRDAVRSAIAPPSPNLAQANNPQSPSATSAAIRFAIADAGIQLTYENGGDPATQGARMFEQTGGGVAAFDFDADGLPDLHFTQGAPWPTGAKAPTRSAEYVDHLYRNLDGQRMREVGRLAGVENLGFAQGVASGDLDGDGFADLYVANVGRNQLYRNNGDGTFSAWDDALEDWPTAWTTSCAIVDLNGDGLADIYDVNYLTGEEVYTLICGGKACSPKVFMGAPDNVFLNRGDGTFMPLNQATPQQEAKGLGVIAARFGDEALNGLFIANDQVPNFFLQAQTLSVPNADPPGDATVAPMPLISLTDRALLRGLAYNMDGLAMACMGIAADDLDGNGLLDLLVTNFMDEPNSLYLQDAPGLFIDATRAAGLQGPSFPYVGWGTQFLDADLDGQSDLVVTNGHVDDYRQEGKPYQMPPQCFRNLGRARFEPIPTEQAGDYFQGMYLGRGLARLDWNADGKMDFAVSHIGQPAALVTNLTQTDGHFLNITLVGTQSSRDPIGTFVEVEADTGTWKKQLVAGDGYQACNQRVLQFGLGNAQRVQRVLVTWPSGEQTILEPPNNADTIDQSLLIIESQGGWSRAGVAWNTSSTANDAP